MTRIEDSASGGSSAREAKWRHVAGLLSDWYGDGAAPTTKPGELDRAEARLGFALPAALRELHERFGHRTDAWNVQDVLYAPHELCVDQGHLVIACENQGVHRWAIPLAALHETDPAVVLLADDERNLRQAAPSICDLAVWWLLLGVKNSPRMLFRAYGVAAQESVCAAIVEHLPRLPVLDIPWFFEPVRLYGDADLVVETQEGLCLWATALDSRPFERVLELAKVAGLEWEQVERPD